MSSAVIQALKTVNEQISDNYTSGQLFDVLDKMLYRAIAPLIENTRYVDRALGITLAWYAQNHRRRISNHSKKRLTAYIVSFLAETDPRKRLLLYRKMKLERNITFFLVQHWLSIVSPWQDMHVSSCRGETPVAPERELMLKCCVINESRLWGTICEARYWLEHTHTFKHRMVEKYMRYVMMDAHTHWKTQREQNPHLDLNLEELAQNFMIAVIKAIDKFDASQGTLTSYVQVWLKNAKITHLFRGEYGIAFTIPHSKRTSIARSKDNTTRNISVSIDAPEALEVADERNIEASIQQRQELDRVRKVAKASDTLGIGRLLLGIPEILDNKELELLLTAKV